MVLAGVLGIVLHRRVLERRFLLAFAMVSVVGWAASRSTRRCCFQLQMLDELPMLYLALVMVYILVENRPERRFGRLVPGGAARLRGARHLPGGAHAGATLQFYLFHVSFASLELFALGRVWLIHRRSQDRPARRLFRLGHRCLRAGDRDVVRATSSFCATLNETLPAHGVPNPQLHAWWHVLVSCGFYALLMVIAHDRLKTLGTAPGLRFAAGVIPLVRGKPPP